MPSDQIIFCSNVISVLSNAQLRDIHVPARAYTSEGHKCLFMPFCARVSICPLTTKKSLKIRETRQVPIYGRPCWSPRHGKSKFPFQFSKLLLGSCVPATPELRQHKPEESCPDSSACVFWQIHHSPKLRNCRL